MPTGEGSQYSFLDLSGLSFFRQGCSRELPPHRALVRPRLMLSCYMQLTRRHGRAQEGNGYTRHSCLVLCLSLACLLRGLGSLETLGPKAYQPWLTAVSLSLSLSLSFFLPGIGVVATTLRRLALAPSSRAGTLPFTLSLSLSRSLALSLSRSLAHSPKAPVASAELAACEAVPSDARSYSRPPSAHERTG